MVARLKAGKLFFAQQGRQGHATANAFTQGHDVGLDTRELIGKQLTGTAHAGLDFIHNQQQATRFSQCTQALHEFMRSWYDTAFSLYRLKHDSDGLVGD